MLGGVSEIYRKDTLNMWFYLINCNIQNRIERKNALSREELRILSEEVIPFHPMYVHILIEHCMYTYLCRENRAVNKVNGKLLLKRHSQHLAVHEEFSFANNTKQVENRKLALCHFGCMIFAFLCGYKLINTV